MSNLLKYLTLFLFVFFLNSPVFGFSDSTKLKDIDFNSNFEQSCFEHFVEHQQFDTLGFLLSINAKSSKKDVSNIQNSLNIFIDRVNTEGGKKKKNFKKFADYLFEQVHTQFLKKYEENVPFDKIFSTGTYNCLTASALYALIFERMGIRYQIKETPTHVYVIADPGVSDILIETTNPTGGYFAPDEKFKKKYVNELIASKIVTANEVASEGSQTIFEKHFYENESINLQQLAGLHYYNAGIALSGLETYPEAVNSFEKGYIIYPCKRIGFSMRTTIAANISKIGQDGFDKIENIAFLLKILKTDSSHRMQTAYVADFERLAERHIIQKDNQPYFEQVNVLFQKAITDTLSLKKMTEIKWSYLGKAAILKGEIEKGGDYFGKALQMSPSNVQYSGVVVGVFAEKFGRDMRRAGDSDTLQKRLDTFFKQYPLLATHSIMVTLQGTVLVGQVEDMFEKGNTPEGFALLQKMETYIKANKVKLSPDFVASPYIKIVLNYVNQKNYTEAKTWIAKGTAACPDCIDIPKRLKDLGNDIETYHLDLSENERMKAIKRDAKVNKKN